MIESVVTVDAASPDPRQLNKTINTAYPFVNIEPYTKTFKEKKIEKERKCLAYLSFFT